MPRRREFKCLAAGIAGKFCSRNNDLDGYWALGVLYKLASEASTNKVILDLLPIVTSPNLETLKVLALRFRKYLISQIHRRGFDVNQVKHVVISITFNVIPTKEKNTWGEPYLCCVRIIDDLDNHYKHIVGGWCGKHDPQKELKSTLSK